MFLLIGLISLLIYAGLVAYIGWSGYRWLRPHASSRRFKWLYAIVVTFVASSFFIGLFTDLTILSRIGAYWMAVFYLLLLLVPVAHLTVVLLRRTRLSRHGTRLWTGLGTLGLLVFFLAYGTYNAYSPVVRTYEIRMERGASALDSLSVAMAADMHFGLLSGKDHAERLVKEINALQPDLVLMPGDLIDDDIRPFVDQRIDDTLSKLQATYGVYATLGNHDKYDGTMQHLIETLERSGIDILYDETVTVQDQLTLIGRKDRSDDERLPLDELMEGVDLSKPVFLLDHQPYELDEAERAGIDLMVSGHTHRGQVFPGHLITNAIYENDWGYLKKERMHSVVTSGFGFWGPPIRIGTRSEIVHLLIRFE